MSTASLIDPIALARALIRAPSVTPRDEGAMDKVEQALSGLGFSCRRMRFGEIENLYARLGAQGPNLCFAGHTDVVPVGDAAQWTKDPFGAEIADAMIWGRGAVDMKSAIAAWIGACSQVLGEGPLPGSLSLLITGDEEGQAIDGTRAVVEQLKAEGEVIDHCIVGEPTSAARLGDMVKIGRRGSVNIWIEVEGRQGHVAYPQRAANPVSALVALLTRLDARVLDDGFTGFQPSNLEITEIEVGNPAQNVIPAKARARINIRFNPGHRGAALIGWVEHEARALASERGVEIAVNGHVSGEAFLTEPDAFVSVIEGAIRDTLGETPDLSTTGGTSDARFIRALCPVVEFGLVGTTMHMVDERVPTAEVEALARTYGVMIRRYFESARR